MGICIAWLGRVAQFGSKPSVTLDLCIVFAHQKAIPYTPKLPKMYTHYNTVNSYFTFYGV